MNSGKNYSSHLFNAIKDQQKAEHASRAQYILDQTITADQKVDAAERALRKAKKRQKLIDKCLKKYKKTGNVKHLRRI